MARQRIMDDLDFSIAETRVQKKDKARKGKSGAQSDKREKVKSAKKTSDKGKSAKAKAQPKLKVKKASLKKAPAPKGKKKKLSEEEQEKLAHQLFHDLEVLADQRGYNCSSSFSVENG